MVVQVDEVLGSASEVPDLTQLVGSRAEGAHTRPRRPQAAVSSVLPVENAASTWTGIPDVEKRTCGVSEMLRTDRKC